MAALDAAQAGSLGTLEVSCPSSEAGDTARRPLDQEWQRARAAVSALARACLLHAPGAPSHATLHPRRIRDAMARPPPRVACQTTPYQTFFLSGRAFLFFLVNTQKNTAPPCAPP